MPGLLSQRARPWLGSAALHVAFIALLAVAAFNWRSDPPPPEQLAIEGSVVRYEDLPARVRAGKPLREPEPAAKPPQPAPPPPAVEPDPTPPVEETAQQQAQDLAREQQRLAAERQAAQQRTAELERTQAQKAQQQEHDRALAEQQRAADAAEAKRQAAETKRQAEAAKQQEALAAKQRQAEQEQAAREVRARAEREADLKKALASEEEGDAFARSGVVDEYKALLTQTIERNWIRPPSARAGLKCTLYVTQATGGTVIDVKLGECNGDQAVRESVANAVYRSSPLPAPRDPRAFQRQLVMNFEPKE